MNLKFKPLSFPRDNKTHKAVIEWWYFNGHLWDKDKKHYSFMDCFFKADIKKINLPLLSKIPFKKNFGILSPYVYFSHSVLSDITGRKNYKDIQNISLVSSDSFSRPLLFVNYINPLIVRGYANYEISETSPFNFHVKTGNLDLRLESKKQPLLEGGRGYISLGKRKSYYYSLTDLSAEGEITIGKKRVEVKGKAWMDHQWANAAYNEYKDKWSWFSLQMENGTDIACIEYTDGKNKDCLVDIMDAKGKTEHYSRLLLTPGKDVWHSKKTKAKYPMSWRMEIPDKKIKLNVRSTMPDQEMIYGPINYWEGPVEAKGAIGKKKIKGIGFMELVGYPSDYNYLILTAKELTKNK